MLVCSVKIIFSIIFSDNFFLGGPLNIRGFDLRGVGPHSDGKWIWWKEEWVILSLLLFKWVTVGQRVSEYEIIECSSLQKKSMSF